MSQPTATQGRSALFNRSAALLPLARTASAVIVFAAGASTLSASLWENNDWAVIGDLEGSVTYDSNVLAFEDEDRDTSDTYFGARPALTLQRKGSASDINLTADVRVRRFIDFSELNSEDPSVSFNFRYPNTGVAAGIARQQARLLWTKFSYPDYSVGNRVERTELSGSWEGVLRDNGRTKIIARLDGSDQDYSDFRSDVFNLGGGVGLAWSRTALFEYTLSADYDHSEYDRGEVGDIESITRKSYRLNVGARGEFTPKITGSARIGFGKSEYSGDFGGSDNDWSTAADVTWKPRERQSITLNANRGTSFDALGRSYDRLDASLSYRQGMAGGFYGVARVGMGEYDYSDLGNPRKDTYTRFGAGIDYDLTGRFIAGLDFNWTDRDSDLARHDFSQYEITGRASYRF